MMILVRGGARYPNQKRNIPDVVLFYPNIKRQDKDHDNCLQCVYKQVLCRFSFQRKPGTYLMPPPTMAPITMYLKNIVPRHGSGITLKNAFQIRIGLLWKLISSTELLLLAMWLLRVRAFDWGPINLAIANAAMKCQSKG